MRLDAFVGLPDGSEWIRDRLEGDVERADRCSAPSSPQRLLGAGAREILDRARRWRPTWRLMAAMSGARPGVVYLVGAGPGRPGADDGALAGADRAPPT